MKEGTIPEGKSCCLRGRIELCDFYDLLRGECTRYNKPAVLKLTGRYVNVVRSAQCLADFPHGAVVELKAKESK